MFAIKLGFRNIIRNFRKTFLTMTAIVIGMSACMMTHGFFNWNIEWLRENMIHYGIGHYQLSAKGFNSSGGEEPFRYLVGEPQKVMKELQAVPGVELVTARVAFNGILSSGEKSTVIVGEAGEPEKEKALHTYSSLTQGSELSSKKPDGLIIGDGAAGKLSAKIGDTLTLMGSSKGGGVNAVDFELVGLSHKGILDLDVMSASASLGKIQSLYGIGAGVQKIVVLLKKTSDMEKVLPAIREISGRYGLEYRPWTGIAEFYNGIKLMYDVVFNIIILIVLVIVTFTVSNTVNMKLYDRIREIGTMRSLGTSNVQVGWILTAESALIGLTGGLIGIAGSALVIAVTELIGGIPVTIQEEGVKIADRIHFSPNPMAVIAFLLLFVLVSVVATVNPSRRAAKLSISDALRWL